MDKAKFFTLSGGPNPIRVGVVPMDKIRQRRANYRRMNEKQKAALKAGIDRIGFQSLVTVIEEPEGMFGIVDGHHRWEELKASGAKMVPVLVLPENTTEEDANLSMFSLNVSAEIDDNGFQDMLTDFMKSGISKEELALHATVDESFMERLASTMDDDVIAPPEEGMDLSQDIKGDTPKKVKAPDVKLAVFTTPNADGNPEISAFVLLKRDMIVSKEFRDALKENEINMEELEIPYATSDDELATVLGEVGE